MWSTRQNSAHVVVEHSLAGIRSHQNKTNMLNNEGEKIALLALQTRAFGEGQKFPWLLGALCHCPCQ